MTYCVGLLVRAGLVMIADTRTNAGIDNISTYRKLHVLADTDERQIFLASAGSLSVTQTMLSLIEEGLAGTDEQVTPRTVALQPTMFRAAQLIGEALTIARSIVRAAVEGSKISANASFLLGGRIGGEPLHLYLIYNEGNFIECQPDAPFLQIGELKYGKPMLDRTLTYDTSLEEAVKVALISFDSTIRSNLSVGLPLDVVALPSDRTQPIVQRRIENDDDYFTGLSRDWGRMLNDSRMAIEDPPFMRIGEHRSLKPETSQV